MRALCLLLLVVLVPVSASAATVDEVVAMSKAGVSESVILALIDRDRTIFSLQADDLVKLKQQGVSDRVVMAMLRSGRDVAPEANAVVEPEPTAVPQPADTTSYQPPPVSETTAQPAAPYSGEFGSVVYAVPYPVPFAVPYAASGVAAPRVRPFHTTANPAATLQFCTSQVSGAPSVPVLTMCPGAVQPHPSHRR
jgi:hypothetical protein